MDAAAAFPSLPPPPAWRSTAAALVRSRRALAATAVAVLIFLILVMVWLVFVSVGVRRIGREACGDGCAVIALADWVLILAMGCLLVLGLIAAVFSTIFMACYIEADKAPSRNDLAAADEPVQRVLILGMLAFLALVLLTLVGSLLEAFSPAQGSLAERSGSIIIDVGVVSIVVLNCFVLLPALALFVWKRTLVIWQGL